MPYTFEDFRREYLAELSPEERLKGLSLEDRLHGLSPEQIKAYLKTLEQAKKPKRGPAAKQRNPRRKGNK